MNYSKYKKVNRYFKQCFDQTATFWGISIWNVILWEMNKTLTINLSLPPPPPSPRRWVGQTCWRKITTSIWPILVFIGDLRLLLLNILNICIACTGNMEEFRFFLSIQIQSEMNKYLGTNCTCHIFMIYLDSKLKLRSCELNTFIDI